MDPELVQRLGEMVWRLLDRLAGIDWSTWSDQQLVGLAFLATITICLVAYIVSTLLYQWRWWMVGTACVIALIYLATRLTPEPTVAPELTVTPEPTGIPWKLWLFLAALAVGLLLWLLWRLLGSEGRREVRLRLVRRILSSSLVLRVLGPPTPGWQGVVPPPEELETEEEEAGEEV